MAQDRGEQRGRLGTAAPIDGGRLGTAAWALFDWANSPFPTVVITFVFPVYFQRAIVGDAVRATELWGYAIALSALLVALLGPVLGAAADAGARRKPWLLVCTVVTVICTGLLWYAAPNASAMWLVLVLVALANVGFELGTVFYNAMLPDLVAPARLGRWSGWAWGLGYAGGLAALALALFALIRAEPPPFGLSAENSEPVRAVAVMVALWFVLFGWPLFAFTPDRPASGQGFVEVLKRGVGQLVSTVTQLGRYREIVRFLIAKMIYIDGLNTLFAFGGIYAAGSFAMTMEEVLIFGIALNVTAGLGAFAFGWIDDWIGGRRTVIIALIGSSAAGAAILLIEDKAWFWALGLFIGIFMGPVQSASRSLMGRMAPPALRAEMFGLYALSGKATAFLGPWLVATVTAAADSQRVGMATILVFFAVGLVLVWPVKEPGRS